MRDREFRVPPVAHVMKPHARHVRPNGAIAGRLGDADILIFFRRLARGGELFGGALQLGEGDRRHGSAMITMIVHGMAGMPGGILGERSSAGEGDDEKDGDGRSSHVVFLS
jgi:hypothetical protein